MSKVVDLVPRINRGKISKQILPVRMDLRSHENPPARDPRVSDYDVMCGLIEIMKTVNLVAEHLLDQRDR